MIKSNFWKENCDTGKKLVSLQSGVHPKTSKRRPAWPLTSSGRMRTYWADTGVPSSWVSGLFLSNEPGKNCKSRRSWMTTCSSYFSSIFIFQRFVNWVWNILQIINKEKKLTYAHFKRFLSWDQVLKVNRYFDTSQTFPSSQSPLISLTMWFKSRMAVTFEWCWNVAHSPPRQRCSRSSSVRPCCAGA